MQTCKRMLAFLTAWLGIFLTGLFIGADLFWAVYWFTWFFVVFLVPEMYWAITNARYTVSGETWQFESLNRKQPFNFADWTGVHWAFAVIYAVFMTLLGLHLVFGFKLFLVRG